MTNENEVNAANNNDGNAARDDLRSEQPTEEPAICEIFQFPSRNRGTSEKKKRPTEKGGPAGTYCDEGMG